MSGNRRTSGVCHTRGCRRSRDAYCSSFRDSACGSLPLTVPRLNWIFPLTSARAFLRESSRLPPWKLLRLRAPPSLILFRSSVSFSSRVAHSFRFSIAIIRISTFSIPRLLYYLASFSFYLHLPIFWSFSVSLLLLFLYSAPRFVPLLDQAAKVWPSRVFFEAEWNEITPDSNNSYLAPRSRIFPPRALNWRRKEDDYSFSAEFTDDLLAANTDV